ncbi:site-2 protease family protein [Haloarcula pellucida]|uniref:Site-2 protease family protein n=1 Tax=Haloarcula pellucida TaxID=1427151 RepID=A0A830GHC8_9EURY|nr:site-2 protease family protein [Halomicroarcula pellucida]MBX0346666.1 site-2 protease family protein [Halomicroarcula pellucida]GGN84881.1 site-2 protease family protein [Halomicroarcula pellucida]
MAQQSSPTELPDPERLADAFRVYEIDPDAEDGVRYYGEPQTESEQVLRRVGPTFRKRGYRVRLQRETGEHVLVASERSLGVDGVPWLNVVLAVATLLSTLYAGSRWYGLSLADDPTAIVQAWPFAAAVLGILAVHEFGHYALSRYHEVQASLPYFIPLPFNVIGTLGAVIRMNDNMPDRDALFDIGVAGPLAGLAATVVVTAVGVTMDPIRVTGGVATQIELGYPLLIRGIAALMGEQVVYSNPAVIPNPVVIGAWVGAFVTFLNLLPVGQLDGAHVTRSLLGERMSAVQTAVPVVLFGLAGYLFVFENGDAAALWGFWGVLTLVFGRVGSVTPLDETAVGPKRQAIGVLTLVLGLLCFVPVPIAISL